MNTDILDEEDSAAKEVQDVLNQLSQSMGGGSSDPSPPSTPKAQPQPQYHNNPEPKTIYYPLPQTYDGGQPGGGANAMMHLQNQQNQQPVGAASQWSAAASYTQFAPDIRSAVLVAIACAVAQVVPIEVLVARFVPSIQSFAHSHVVLKALLAGLIFFFVSKYV
jgi:hypothetical protein